MAESSVGRGRCKKFSPTFRAGLSEDWAGDTGSWQYDKEKYLVQYMGAGEDTDSPPFLKFWRKPRWLSSHALLKKNYWCENTLVRAEVRLDGAEEAGVIFRVRGTWDFWGVLLSRTKVDLVRMREGERRVLRTENYSPGTWTALVGEEMIGDVNMYFGPDFNQTVKSSWEGEDFEDELMDESQGAAGLIAYGGPATFRNVVLGELEWDSPPSDADDLTDPEEAKKTSVKKNEFDEAELLSILLQYELDLRSWCPDQSFCADRRFVQRI